MLWLLRLAVLAILGWAGVILVVALALLVLGRV